MSGYAIEEVDALEGFEGSMDDLSAAIDRFNMKQSAVGGGIGSISGVAVPSLLKLWTPAPAKGGGPMSIGEFLKIVSPAALLGVLGAWVGKGKPVVGGSIAASGFTLTTAMLMEKLVHKEVTTGITVTFDTAKGLEKVLAEKLMAVEETTAQVAAGAGPAAALSGYSALGEADELDLFGIDDEDQAMMLEGPDEDIDELSFDGLAPVYAEEEDEDFSGLAPVYAEEDDEDFSGAVVMEDEDDLDGVYSDGGEELTFLS